MKRALILLTTILFLTSIISADIIITEQPNNVYGSGETLSFPIKIASSIDINEFITMELICDGTTTEIHKEFLSISSGEEKKITTDVPLIQSFMGKTSANCKIKSTIAEIYVLSDEFEVTDTIEIIITTEQQEYSPEEIITIEGTATKGVLIPVIGIVEILLKNEDETFSSQDTIADGNIKAEIQIPKDAKAGTYYATIRAHEKDFKGDITNNGESSYSFKVRQIPKNMEIVLSSREIEPEEKLIIKPILHDQSGENINTDITLKILDSNSAIIEERIVKTSEESEFKVLEGELPSNWRISATYEDFEDTKEFKILPLEKIQTTITNQTLTIRNIGNVKYNKTISIQIGTEERNIKTHLEVGEEDHYSLSAPEGSYDIEISSGKHNYTSQGVMLTGNAIDIKKAGVEILNFVGRPIVWIFIIIIISFMTFLIYKKGYKKSFFGYIYKRKKRPVKKEIEVERETLTNPIEKAKFSLSIKGNKQDSTLVCLKIKNFKEVKDDKTNAKATLQKVTHIAEKFKASTYESHDNFFFILAPIKTRTFDNEMSSVKLAEKIKETLDNHNKMFKQKIDYGIGINKGTIVAAPEGKVLNFATIGTFATVMKKIANISKQQILLAEPIKDKLLREVSTKKHTHEKLVYYSIEEIKNTSEKREVVNELLRKMSHR